MADASASSAQEQQRTRQNPAAEHDVAPLEREVVLQVVFSMLGPSVWIQLAGVNRQWRDVYAAMTESKTTSAAYALANLSTYVHCVDSGRNVPNDSPKEQRLLGMHADVAVLDNCALALFYSSWAGGLGARNLFHRDEFEELRSRTMPPDNTTEFMWIAAIRGSLECLQYLCTTSAGASVVANQQKLPMLGWIAAKGGNVHVLAWMLEQGLLMHYPGGAGGLSAAVPQATAWRLLCGCTSTALQLVHRHVQALQGQEICASCNGRVITVLSGTLKKLLAMQ
jgi:hypothetical protein